MASGLWRLGLLLVGGAAIFVTTMVLVMAGLPLPHSMLDYPVAVGLAFLIFVLLILAAAALFLAGRSGRKP